jgi:hypothetical protein
LGKNFGYVGHSRKEKEKEAKKRKINGITTNRSKASMARRSLYG